MTFLLCLVPFSGVAYYFAIVKPNPWSALFVMCSPGLAAIAASIIVQRRLSEVGWRPGPLKYLLVGWLAPLGYGGVTYGVAWLTGIGQMPSA